MINVSYALKAANPYEKVKQSGDKPVDTYRETSILGLLGKQ